MDIDGRLEHELTLARLIPRETLRHLCRRFAAVVGMPVAALDADHSLLGGETRPPDVEAGSRAKIATWTEGAQAWMRGRVDNQFETAGWLVLGPFAPAATAEASAALAFLLDVVEELVHANYRSLLVEKMHLQSRAEAVGELCDKEQELLRYEATLRASERLRTLF